MPSNKHPRLSDECNGARGMKKKNVGTTEVEILQKLEKGVSVCNLCDHFDVGSSMIYYIEKQCEKLLKFSAKSVAIKGTTKHKVMRGTKLAKLDKLVYKW